MRDWGIRRKRVERGRKGMRTMNDCKHRSRYKKRKSAHQTMVVKLDL